MRETVHRRGWKKCTEISHWFCICRLLH